MVAISVEVGSSCFSPSRIFSVVLNVALLVSIGGCSRAGPEEHWDDYQMIVHAAPELSEQLQVLDVSPLPSDGPKVELGPLTLHLPKELRGKGIRDDSTTYHVDVFGTTDGALRFKITFSTDTAARLPDALGKQDVAFQYVPDIRKIRRAFPSDLAFYRRIYELIPQKVSSTAGEDLKLCKGLLLIKRDLILPAQEITGVSAIYIRKKPKSGQRAYIADVFDRGGTWRGLMQVYLKNGNDVVSEDPLIRRIMAASGF